MLDLIKPKLVYLDLPLFMALLSDLFPGVELPASDGGNLRRAIEAELKDHNLQVGGWSSCRDLGHQGQGRGGGCGRARKGGTYAIPSIHESCNQ